MNIKGMQVMSGNSVKHHIMDYINNIPKWEGFTIEEVALKFRVTPNYMSKIAKEAGCAILVQDKTGHRMLIVNPKHKGEYLGENRSE